ncbi:MAG: endopeptidase La [Leptospiraceae bacterium]|nr:endopeptidase La [Leptospiraceae bacterium]
MEKEQNVIVSVDQILPDDLFIIPIRYRPVFPGMVTPLVIAQGHLAEAIENISKSTGYIGLVMQEDDSATEIEPDKLFKVGTVVKILKKIQLPDGGLHLLVNTLQRFTIKKYLYSKPNVLAKVEYVPDKVERNDKEIITLTRAALAQAREMMTENPLFTEEMKVTLINVDDPGKIADFICSILNLEKKEYQQILETFDIRTRLEKTLHFLARELELLKLQKKIQGKINDKIEQQQRDYYLREQMRAIRSELGSSEKEKDGDYYRQKLEAIALPEEAKEKSLEECEKLDYVDPSSHEYGIIRNYLDTVLELPWENPGFEDIDIDAARNILNREHFGLEDVKERIIEHLAVKKLRKNEKGSIICLVGPPGVGKTSLGKSVAKAMKKNFYRFSLGGMRDEAEIKGHRRTYVGAMPGKIIQALKVVKSKNPVLMLDEIDKLGISFQGDPASALLEVLDPQQNSDFRDHFLDLPFDLSFITFITTANTVESIPGPLLDRMEVIQLSGYILEEKMKIAQKYVIPKIKKEYGLEKAAPKFSTNALRHLVDSYSREAGVRSLEKLIRKIYRKIAVQIVEKKKKLKEITPENLKELVGPPVFSREEESKVFSYGCAIGLAYTSMGGATLMVECRATPGRGRVKITGQLGKVMTESVEIALSFVRGMLDDEKFFTRNDLHVHVPDGATPKDGPSAGITISTAILSLYRKQVIKQGFAMTGEIRLTGQVLPIGGLKEKTIAARRIGIKNLIFPYENQKDWEELPDFLKKGMKVYPVKNFSEVEKLLFTAKNADTKKRK